jgi:hypothetical protein
MWNFFGHALGPCVLSPAYPYLKLSYSPCCQGNSTAGGIHPVHKIETIPQNFLLLGHLVQLTPVEFT